MDTGEDHGENGSEGGAQPDEEGKEEPPQGAEEELMTPGADRAGEGADIEEEAEAQRALRDPGLPSREEREEHMLSHLPFRPWCDACVRGRARDKMSLRLAEAYSRSCMPRVRMDVDTEQDPGAGDSVTVLVMQESVCRSVWAYAVGKKGSTEDLAVNLVAEDLDTVGL